MGQIAVIGLGYVGLATAAVLADLGHHVVGVDIDAQRIARLQTGECPIWEPELPELLARVRAAGRFVATTEIASAVPQADIAFICVNTPAGSDGAADMRAVRQAAAEIGRCLPVDRRVVIVNKSTMPVGSGELVDGIVRQHAPRGARWGVVSNPEFMREGSAVHDMFHPDRVVIGASNPADAATVAALYTPLEPRVLITDVRTAEMVKYASNAFLATKISFINEIAAICEAIGADVRDVAKGMGMDARIGPAFLNAGAGFGGSCFPKDVQALEVMAAEAGCHPQLLPAVLEVNRSARAAIVRKLARLTGGLAGKTVAVWGLAFKPNTDDLREAPALDIIRDLLTRGASVRAWDPVAMPAAARLLPEVTYCADPYAAAAGADAVVLVTEWSELADLDLLRVRDLMAHPILVDGRNVYDPRRLAALGFTYRGVGVPSRPPSRTAHLQAAAGG